MDRSLVSVRTALVLLLAVLSGVGAGLLSASAGAGTAAAVLAGLTTTGGAIAVFNQMIAADPVHNTPAGREAEAKGGSTRG
ncbi:hypothetical protein [Streptomyces sp. TS71-3]|uniref:hypothetical protein n=1 Tax=Streptomyces sp. TS71-3 TaxID=2733862 RepID=UPI001B1DFCAF|nr:hypothetical protein [Streptomyces sp. TS71-3]GHJ40968.1 hypothetical protein Sm713_65770 [Streptomyces sp. TS71-3]